MKISRVQKEYWLKQLIVGSFLPSVHNLHISPQKSVLFHDSLLPQKFPLFKVLRGCSSVSQASVVSPSAIEIEIEIRIFPSPPQYLCEPSVGLNLSDRSTLPKGMALHNQDPLGPQSSWEHQRGATQGAR